MPLIKRRLDYTSPAFLVPHVALVFDLDPQKTLVTATLHFERQSQQEEPLILQGRNLTLTALFLNGTKLAPEAYQVTSEALTIFNPGNQGVLTIHTKISPADNTELYGLYLSSGVFCTQCEAEGFRRITYFPDRPDVLSRYTVEIRANATDATALLSNGNLIEEGNLADGRRFARWSDPFPKPCYLFALVAGKLEKLQDHFITRSGRKIRLEIYTTQENLAGCDHAMQSLKHAMRWDEERYRREYDLDRFMIFCADDFNMGAMENKGLNIFNSALILAHPDTATDDDYHAIESVIAHEYFHNWTGNRVTCQDWFQLSLKEGLTVFRDQQFSSDMGDPATERVAMVEFLRQRQFPEDAGPTAHPVRPDEYQEINNFYTMTVYEKGAELIRMMHTLLGEAAFQRGMDLYFSRHDGKAVTCDDFVAALQDASGVDLTRFKRWYAQAGTPVVTVATHYDERSKTYTLNLSQETPPTPGQPHKEPVVIPVNTALIGADGTMIPLKTNLHQQGDDHQILVLEDQKQSFTFEDVPSDVVPSLLRGGSAPVLLRQDLSFDALARIARFDPDGVARWDAMSQILVNALVALARHQKPLPPTLIALYRHFLNDENIAPMLRARSLALPNLAALVDLYVPFEVKAYVQALKTLQNTIAMELHDDLMACFDRHHQARGGEPYSPTLPQSAHRALAAFSLRAARGSNEAIQRAVLLYRHADNMSDTMAALYALRDSASDARQTLWDDFLHRWRNNALVLDKYFSLEATAQVGNVLARVQALMSHPAFSLKNPNRVRALLGSFALRNFEGFHDEAGEGYAFIGKMIDELDGINPHSASMLLNAFRAWRKWDAAHSQRARQVLEGLRGKKRSPEISELLEKLGGDQ